mmetsp:Transcript_61768/g.122233  ORF Transcript_61768/g.122233 Transcript_61768/m.122233 type:complete len:118 (-) Transcript_61768:268-621(-)
MSSVRKKLGQQSVQAYVHGTLHVQVVPADVIQRFIVHDNRDIRVLKQGIHTQDCILSFHQCHSNVRAYPGGETEFEMRAVVQRQKLKHQAEKSKTRTLMPVHASWVRLQPRSASEQA